MLWLAMPWRAASRLVVGLCYGLAGRRQPLALLGIVVVAAVAIAVGQAVQQGHWAVAAVLSGVFVCAVVCPLADAYVARRSEFAADRFAAARVLPRSCPRHWCSSAVACRAFGALLGW
jgi:hypothetical protein